MWSIKHTKTGQILTIEGETTTIGRLGTTYTLKNDDSISRKHCTFLLNKNGLQLFDNGSKYGTKINDDSNQISKVPVSLKAGDKIHFGCFENIWEIVCRQEKDAASINKRKHSDENSLSISNVAKKVKETPTRSRPPDKYDLIIESSDEEPIASRSTRQTRNILQKKDETPATSSKDSLTKNKNDEGSEKAPEISARSQILFDSDEDIFSTSTQNPKGPQKVVKPKTKSKTIFDSDEEIISPPKRALNSRKRPMAEPEKIDNTKKVPRTTRNLRNSTSNNVDKAIADEEPSTSKRHEVVVPKIATPAPKNIEIERVQVASTRKRVSEDNFFNFEAPRRATKRTKQDDISEDINVDNTDSSIVSRTSSVKNSGFKTKNLCNKELYASFEYNIDEDDSSCWLSSKMSTIKVKDEPYDETDGSSINNSAVPSINCSINIVRRTFSLNETVESGKCFAKQQYLESSETVELKRINVKDMNAYYSNDESISTWN